MSLLTNFLNLFKYEETDEGNFDIQIALNDNWDKIDAAVKANAHALAIKKSGLTLLLANWIDNTATTGFYEQIITDADVSAADIVDLYFDSNDLKNKMTDVGVNYVIEQSGAYLIQFEGLPTADITYKLVIQKAV